MEGDGRPGCFDIRPREDPEDSVSRESVPFSSELDTRLGRGGTASAGASIPFLVVDPERELKENKPLAFGAEATRRMKRDAEALIAFGDSGPCGRDFEGVVGDAKDVWEGFGVCAFDERAEVGFLDKAIRCFSDFEVEPGFGEAPAESASADCGCWYGGNERLRDPFCGTREGMPPLESLDWVLDEL